MQNRNLGQAIITAMLRTVGKRMIKTAAYVC